MTAEFESLVLAAMAVVLVIAVALNDLKIQLCTFLIEEANIKLKSVFFLANFIYIPKILFINHRAHIFLLFILKEENR